MKAALVVAAGWMLSGAVVQGSERGFDDLVRVISDQLHARPMHIPFFGLVNLATFVAHPAGVKHVELVVFENLDLDQRATKNIVDALRAADGGWKPFVQVQSWKDGDRETVFVYLEQKGEDCRFLVITLEARQATLVEVRLNPEGLQAWLNHPQDAAGGHNAWR